MSADQVAIAEPTLAPRRKRREGRILGPLAVSLALLSAFITFVVLASAQLMLYALERRAGSAT